MHKGLVTILVLIGTWMLVYGTDEFDFQLPSQLIHDEEIQDRNLIDETATDLSVMPYIDGSIDDENTPTLEPQTPIDRVAPETFTTTSNYTLTTQNPTFRRPHGNPNGDYYYDVFELISSVNGTYEFKSNSSFDTYGLLYSPSFDDTQPMTNLLVADDDGAGTVQFFIAIRLEENVQYYLVVTTYAVGITDSYRLLIEGPSVININRITVLSISMPNVTVTSALFYYHPRFSGPDNNSNDNYYYDLFQVNVPITGNYTFESRGIIDLYGLLYYPIFDPTLPRENRLVINGDLNNYGRFRISQILRSDRNYFLVVTSVSPLSTGNYSVTLKGPQVPTLRRITNLTSSSRGINGILRRTRRFLRPNAIYASYFYDVYEVKIRRSSYYSLESNSSVDLMGFLYMDNFIASASDFDLWTYDDNSAGNGQFLIERFFRSQETYYLVVTTSARRITGHYRITATGPINALFILVPSALNQTTIVSSEWTTTSRIFRRPYGFGHNHYYQLFRFTVETKGLYSIAASSLVDSFGYIYTSAFNSSLPWNNLLTQDDQSGGEDQFELTLILNVNVTYYLVATTYREFRFGTFNITVIGPGQSTIVLINSKKR